MQEASLFLGGDVSTGGARAWLFTVHGRKVGSATFPIRMWRPRTDFIEQSSDDIWKACATAI